MQSLRWIPTEDVASALYGSGWSDYIIDIPPTLFSRFTFGDVVLENEAKDVDRGVLRQREQLGQ